MMLILWSGFLLLTHLLCHVNPQECDTKYQYKDDNVRCCKKCEPGYYMEKRCTKSSETLCKQCRSDYYMDEYSKELVCLRCSQCTKEHMVYKKNCSSTSDAVCDCESGYKCNSKPCTDCVKIPTTAPPPPTTTTKTTTTVITNAKIYVQETTASQDTVWITLSLCCVCILLTCFILISRHTLPCGWIMLASTGSFGDPRKLLPNLVSAQRMRKCRCQSRRCVDIRSGKKKSEGDRGKQRERGRKRHIRVWIDYEL